MSMRMSADDQFKFLLSCVKWSVNGKVDFTEVALECGVVSKGAAAKRYERMLKNHGIHPNGGPLDSPTPIKEKSISTAKVSKKRKQDEPTGPIKYDEDEDRKPPLVKRPRMSQQHDIKQEQQPPMGYPPYMYHPMMHQGPFMSRQMPPYMHPGMPHPQAPHPPFHMMPGMHNVPPYMMPQQTQPFPMNQNFPPLNPESNNLGSFEDFCNQDFGNGNFETLLHGEQPVIPTSNEFPQTETLLLSHRIRQTSTSSNTETTSNIKVEPVSLWKAPSSEIKPIDPVPSSAPESPKAASVPPTVVAKDVPAPASPPMETVTMTAGPEVLKPCKLENEGCIFIAD